MAMVVSQAPTKPGLRRTQPRCFNYLIACRRILKTISILSNPFLGVGRLAGGDVGVNVSDVILEG